MRELSGWCAVSSPIVTFSAQVFKTVSGMSLQLRSMLGITGAKIRAEFENVLKVLLALDQLFQRVGILRRAPVVENASGCVEKYEMGNTLDLILLDKILLLVEIYCLERDISEFGLCCVKHGRKCFARPSPVRVEFEYLLHFRGLRC